LIVGYNNQIAGTKRHKSDLEISEQINMLRYLMWLKY